MGFLIQSGATPEKLKTDDHCKQADWLVGWFKAN